MKIYNRELLVYLFKETARTSRQACEPAVGFRGACAERSRALKFIFNNNEIGFFSEFIQHKEFRLGGLVYDHDYRGNAAAGLINMNSKKVEIRYHEKFSAERVRGLWNLVVNSNPDLSFLKEYRVEYRGKELPETRAASS